MTSALSLRGVYAGIFLLCLSTIVYEIALTRVFSALMYYHFASMAIALALLGMGLGGMIVYARPGRFGIADGRRAWSNLCLFYGASLLVLYLAGLLVTRFPEAASAVLSRFHTPYYGQGRLGAGTGGGSQGAGLAALVGLAGATMVPFLLSGMVVSAMLTGFPGRANSLYLADMLGAGAGALAVILLMSWVGGPGALLFSAASGLTAAVVISGRSGSHALKGGVFVLLLGAVTCLWVEHNQGLVRFDFVGGRYEPGVLASRWNSFSRVLVYKGKTGEMQERAWGVSRIYSGPRPEELNIVINDTGFTTMVKAGPESDLTSLKFDVTNLPFMMRPGGRALVIGPGGGRDVLSALEFGSRDVTAVEVNPLLRDIVEDAFGDFTGRPYSLPGVKLVIDDGRSFLLRDKTQYDVIESARVYEWVEAMSGAFTFSENYLYTKEAFRDYLSRLNEDGLLSITRFIHEKQALRIPVLALSAYRELGVRRPQDSIAILKERGLATFLFKKTPFTVEELQKLADISADLGFEAVYLPGRDLGNDFSRLIASPDRDAFIDSFPLDLSPTTDDRPFFNYMIKRGQFWAGLEGARTGRLENQALMTLRGLIGAMSLLSVCAFLVPLAFFGKKDAGRTRAGRLPLLVFFSAVGMGFMLVEITFLRKFILFLGHPVYSLSVVLFVLLVSAGFGSLLFGRCGEERTAAIMWATPPTIMLYAFLPGLVFEYFLASSSAVRILVSVALLVPVGLLLGGMFPAGIRRAGAHGLREYIPWFWAMNGVFSVLGTVFALVFAMSFGFTATILAGSALYGVAAASFRLAMATGGDCPRSAGPA